MKRKFVVGLAPVLAIAAFAVVPMVAQAAPHYYINGSKLKGGAPKTKVSIAWGNITLNGTKGSILGGHITCHNAAAGTVFNPEPEEGPAGEGLTTQFAPFSCEQEKICPIGTTSVEVKPESLPWKNLLTEEVAGTIRQETTGIKVVFVCHEGGLINAELKFVIGAGEKGQRPKGVAGTGALHPGVLEFDTPGSGELELEGSLGGVKGNTSGAVKTLGYNAQELINVASP